MQAKKWLKRKAALWLGFRKATIYEMIFGTMLGLIGTMGAACITLLYLLLWPGAREALLPSLGGSLAGVETAELLWLTVKLCLIAPILEEIGFRGILWRLCEKGSTSPFWCIPVTALMFTVAHFIAGMGFLYVIAKLPIAFTLGFTRYVTQSVWPCVAGHVANNSFVIFGLIISLILTVLL
jgi:membrane protease YdiL (CAAX protease family)